MIYDTGMDDGCNTEGKVAAEPQDDPPCCPKRKSVRFCSACPVTEVREVTHQYPSHYFYTSPCEAADAEDEGEWAAG